MQSIADNHNVSKEEREFYSHLARERGREEGEREIERARARARTRAREEREERQMREGERKIERAQKEGEYTHTTHTKHNLGHLRSHNYAYILIMMAKHTNADKN